jgi:polyisoprenoid-binding protein YceI
MKARWTTELQTPRAFLHAPRVSLLVVATALLVFASLSEPVSARQTVFSTEAGHVRFDSRMPVHAFHGTSEQLVGQISLADSTVDFFIDLATLDTGNGKRDKDMRSTLEVDEYPFAEFLGKLVTPFDEASSDPQPATTRGTFTVHGISREVEISGTLQRTVEGLQLTAEFDVRLEDHEIVPPRMLLMKVRDVQEVSIDVALTPVEG